MTRAALPLLLWLWCTLAQATGVEEAVLAHRLMGDWAPDTTSFAAVRPFVSFFAVAMAATQGV